MWARVQVGQHAVGIAQEQLSVTDHRCRQIGWFVLTRAEYPDAVRVWIVRPQGGPGIRVTAEHQPEDDAEEAHDEDQGEDQNDHLVILCLVERSRQARFEPGLLGIVAWTGSGRPRKLVQTGGAISWRKPVAGTPMRELAEIVRLQKGKHRRPDDGVCAMELVAWMAGEKHSDQPRSASPVIAAFSRSFNDGLEPAHRQRLALLAARMIGTRGGRDHEVVRSQMLWDWMIATAVPTWLAAAQRSDLAGALVAGRATALDAATGALDAHGYAPVRPADDDRTTACVSNALAACGVTGACLAGRDVADRARGSRARRQWEAARVLARAAAWSVAESGPGVKGEQAQAHLWRTAATLRDSAFVLLDRLIAVTEPLPPPPPPEVAPTNAEADQRVLAGRIEQPLWRG